MKVEAVNKTHTSQHTREVLEEKLITVFHIAHFFHFCFVQRNIFDMYQHSSPLSVSIYILHFKFALPHLTTDIYHSRKLIHTLFTHDAPSV